MKFGGTSMGSAERIEMAARLAVEQKLQRHVLVVVSAMSKVTDTLLDTLRRAESGDKDGVKGNIAKLKDRHFDTAKELLPRDRQKPVLAALESLLAEFERICSGMMMLGDRPLRAVDEAIAIGERMSALLMAASLEANGTRAVAANAKDFLITDAVFGNANPLMDLTRSRSREYLFPILKEGVLPIVTGFNGATEDGRPTTLGRGGSDYSASILAAVLDASELWIWTDVDGIMTADPRLVPDAAVLAEVTYREAAELAYNGAKVLHPRTLAPLEEKKIPVWSKNSFAPEKPGTRIAAEVASLPGPRAVTSMSNVALVTLEPANAGIAGTRMMARAVEALASAGAEILAFSSSSYRQSFCVLMRQAELPAAMEALKSTLSLELAHGYLKPIEVDTEVGLIAVVGEGMQGAPGLAGRIFTAISRQNINIIAIAQGSNELTIAIVVRRSGLEAAVRAVHDDCGLSTLGRKNAN
jgi:bifunctional aspartokinase / homoserine dehydrogenase 1